MEDCSICHSELKNQVYMTCGSKHPFCFECLLKSVEATKELKSCPLCRGGDKFIMVDQACNQIEGDHESYYSLHNFKKSIPILQKVLKQETSNTCLVSDKILIAYIKNKKQLEFSKILLSHKYEIDEILSFIRWEKEKDIRDDVCDFLSNIAVDVLYRGNGGGAPQNQPNMSRQTDQQLRSMFDQMF
jgi:hypothetical protein